MKCIATEIKEYDIDLFENAEKKYLIIIRDSIKNFISANGGGYPVKEIISSDGDEYEVRVFLSADKTDKYYSIEKPMDYFLQKTNGKIVPIGVDSGDNYYCVNNETEKVYYWIADEDKYYCIADSIEDFVKLFE